MFWAVIVLEFSSRCGSHLALLLGCASSLLACAAFGCFRHLGLGLRLHWLAGGALLLLPVFSLLDCRVLRLLPELRLLRLLLTDIFEGHTNDGLLELLGLARASLAALVGLALFVHATPCLRPFELNWFDALMEERIGLAIYEKVDLAILRHESLAAAGVDAVFRVCAEVSLDHHCEKCVLNASVSRGQDEQVAAQDNSGLRTDDL